MALMAHGTIGSSSGRQLGPITVSAVAIEVPANDIAIYALEDVPLYRQLEITNGWMALINFIRDRRLLDVDNTDSPPGFRGAIIYSGQRITSMGEGGDRRTASDIIFFNPDDIVVGIGAGVTGVPPAGLVTPILSGFTKLIQAAREQTLKAA